MDFGQGPPNPSLQKHGDEGCEKYHLAKGLNTLRLVQVDGVNKRGVLYETKPLLYGHLTLVVPEQVSVGVLLGVEQVRYQYECRCQLHLSRYVLR